MPAVTPSVGKFASSKVVFLVDGYNFLAAKVQNLRHKVGLQTEPTDGLGDAWREHSPTGMRFAELAQDGAFFDTRTGNSHEALKDSTAEPMDPARIACVGFAGNAIGQPFTGFEGQIQTEYEVLSTVGNLQRANTTALVSGRSEDGVIVHALTAETVDGNTEASSVDNTTAPQRVVPITSSAAAGDLITCPVPHGLLATDTVLISGHSGSTPAINGVQTVATVPSSTTFSIGVDITVGGTGGSFVRAKSNAGGTGYLQVTDHQLGTWTGAVVTLRHSDDDAVFVDLLAFAAETLTRHAQRVTVAGAVRRYIAQSLDRTGAGAGGSITYLAGFCRS
jgi:hypothetical protein